MENGLGRVSARTLKQADHRAPCTSSHQGETLNNKNDISCLFARKPLPLLCALIVGGLFGTSQAQAGGFMVPTTNTAGWGRAMAGGSLFPNDPSAAFNNPAAMAFIDKRIAQLTINYADIDIKYNGDAYDYQGNPMTGGYQDGPGTPELATNDGGQAGFGAWLPTGFLVVPINDRFAFGLSQVVPMGMRSTWDPNWKGRDFAVDTKIETIGLTGSLSFKVNDNFSLGAGVIIQRTSGFVSQNLDLYASAANSPGMGGIPFPASNSSALMRVKVDNTSPGFFAGAVWKPTDRDTLGFAYHAKIRNKLKGHYNLYDHDGGLTERRHRGRHPGPGLSGPGPAHGRFRLGAPGYPRLRLTGLGTPVQRPSEPGRQRHLDRVVVVPGPDPQVPRQHDRLHPLHLPEHLDPGGGRRLQGDRPVDHARRGRLRPDADPQCHPRPADSRRRSLLRLPGRRLSLPVDAGVVDRRGLLAAVRQEVPLKTVNQDRLGGGRLDGRATSKGQVFSLSATYDF